MKRSVQPELLDRLPPTDRFARGSRGDLRRLNGLMGHARLAARALGPLRHGQAVKLVDLGAGDGSFLLSVARRLGRAWPDRRVTLVERQALVSPATERTFAALGWRLEVVQADVLDWLRQAPEHAGEVIVANLFLHHFSTAELTGLLGAIARRACAVLALEPRRSAWALACSRLVGLVGCNRVTRHDAVASVRAGFAGCELSDLWPAGHWSLEEHPAGMFSHCFVARSADSSRLTACENRAEGLARRSKPTEIAPAGKGGFVRTKHER